MRSSNLVAALFEHDSRLMWPNPAGHGSGRASAACCGCTAPNFGIEHRHLAGSPGRTEAARGRRTVLTNSMRCEASGGRFERESAASRCRQGTLDRFLSPVSWPRRSTAEPGSELVKAALRAARPSRVLAALRAATGGDFPDVAALLKPVGPAGYRFIDHRGSC